MTGTRRRTLTKTVRVPVRPGRTVPVRIKLTTTTTTRTIRRR